MKQLLNDSNLNETKSKQLEVPKVQYEMAAKQTVIDSLTNQNQLHRIRVEQASTTKTVTQIRVALLLFIIGIVFNRFLIKHKSNRKLEALQKELDQKSIFLETLNAKQDKWLNEKEWLIRELHHRVKNNLQMVTSLLHTQSVHLKNDAAVQAVKDSLRRVQAMSLIHQKLYQGETISIVSMPEYVNDLVRFLDESFETNNRIVFEQSIVPVELDVTQAIPLGLIINESIVNAMKHAFLDGHNGIVRIHLQRDGAHHLLFKLSDNGTGLPAGLDIVEYNSLGLELMQGLARQLNGSFTIENNNGVHILVRFILLNN